MRTNGRQPGRAPMTAFTQLKQADGTVVEFATAAVPAKRPPRWSPANWPVRWKVLAIALVPLVLAATFGGLRIYGSATQASELRLAADRAELIPDIDKYMESMEKVMTAATQEGGDTQAAMADFTTRHSDLQRRLDATDVVDDVKVSVTTILDKGEALIKAVAANAIDLRTQIISYGPLLLTGESAITGSVTSNDHGVLAQAEGLGRAVGARGQMAIQEMMVNEGGNEPEPLLRTSMITMAGTEPSTVVALGRLLGEGSDEAATLRSEMVKRLAMMSNPEVPLVGNPELLTSLQATDKIARAMIADYASSIPDTVTKAAENQRTHAIRDTILVAIAIVTALVVVWLVARSLIRPLRTLRDSALKVAHEDLAGEIERVRSGGEPGTVTPLPVHTTEEIGQVAHAVDELHQQAVFLAGEQAQLQTQVADMFETLSRRSRTLVDQQLSLIDRLERNEDDPERLESLFRLDHLAARMRRNGANLLVLSGSKVTREHSDAVPIATIINAATSEVEDYTRVVTSTVPETEILGAVSGDLIHLLAELLDNALRYSPPISQVRVSAVHAGTGGLVIEVSDVGLGMTDADLRVANTRLQSGGEVNPYTARHMGLFVVGRLAGQHGLVVRLRSTVPDEPNSGTTAGVYVPAELLVRDGAAVTTTPVGGQYDEPTISTALAGTPVNGTALAAAGFFGAARAEEQAAEPHLNGHADVPIDLLPQRSPGASGISELPSTLAPAAEEPEAPAETTAWPQQWPAAADEPSTTGEPESAPEPASTTKPTNTSSFFASRAQAASNGVNGINGINGFHAPAEAAAEADDGDSIYQSMITEWEIDPATHARSSDLDWQTVWEKGWSVAAAAQDAPVEAHTEEGLPMRNPGARLVPGGVAAVNGRHRNGGVHRVEDGGSAAADTQAVASTAEADSDIFAAFAPRDPEAVRASISSHFSGVHAGRSHARETRGTDSE